MTNPTVWRAIRELIEHPDNDQLTELVRTLTPVDRRAVAIAVKAYAREARENLDARADGTSLAIVGVAVLGDTAATVSWLRRTGLSSFAWAENFDDRRTLSAVHHVASLIGERDQAWQVRFASKLADRLSTRQGVDADTFDLVEIVRRRTGMAPPDSDGYLAQLMYSAWRQADGDVLRARIAEDPRYVGLVPKLFDLDVIGLHLSWSEATIDLIPNLSRDGVVDRREMLDACIGRLQRPGRPKATAAYLAILETLAPTLDEIRVRKRDYLALLPDTLSTVATAAQSALQQVDETDALTAAELGEATRSVLSRPEKKLHKAQLAWLTAHLRRAPADAGMLVNAAAAAFTHPAVDVQRAAVKWITTHSAGLSDDERRELHELVDILPPDLRATLAQGAGLADTANDRLGEHGTISLAQPLPRHRLESVTSDAELGELLLVLIGDPLHVDGASLERALEGLVRCAHGDRDALRRAVSPAIEHPSWRWARSPVERLYSSYCDGVTVHSALSELLVAAIDDPAEPSFIAHCGHSASRAHHAMVHRILDLATQLRAGALRGVVSLPSYTSGAIDAEDFVSRLSAAAVQGWEPVDADIDLALLRVDLTGVDLDDMVRRLSHIGSGRAVRAARSIAAGLPTTPDMRWAEIPQSQWDYSGQRFQVSTLLGVEPVPDDSGADFGHAWREMRDYSISWAMDHASGWNELPQCWPSILPNHRDLVAAQAIGRADLLPLLAESGGAVGSAMHLALARSLAADRIEDRALATDAMLILAAQGQLDGESVGAVLTTLTSRDEISVSRVVGPLRDAATSGAAPQVSALLGVLIGSILGSPAKPPHGFADLVALTAEAVTLGGASIEIAGLDEFAARRGGSRQLVEARRLKELLEHE